MTRIPKELYFLIIPCLLGVTFYQSFGIVLNLTTFLFCYWCSLLCYDILFSSENTKLIELYQTKSNYCDNSYFKPDHWFIRFKLQNGNSDLKHKENNRLKTSEDKGKYIFHFIKLNNNKNKKTIINNYTFTIYSWLNMSYIKFVVEKYDRSRIREGKHYDKINGINLQFDNIEEINKFMQKDSCYWYISPLFTCQEALFVYGCIFVDQKLVLLFKLLYKGSYILLLFFIIPTIYLYNYGLKYNMEIYNYFDLTNTLFEIYIFYLLHCLYFNLININYVNEYKYTKRKYTIYLITVLITTLLYFSTVNNVDDYCVPNGIGTTIILFLNLYHFLEKLKYWNIKLPIIIENMFNDKKTIIKNKKINKQ